MWGQPPGIREAINRFWRTEPVDGISQTLGFAELCHEYERVGDVDVMNIDMPVLVRGEWLSKTFALARLLATWAVQRFTESTI